MKDDPPITPRPGDEKPFRQAYLAAGFIRHTLTGGEQQELDEWLNESEDNRTFFEELIDQKNIKEGMNKMRGINTEAALEKMKERISLEATRKPVLRSFWPYIAAACILAAVAFPFLYRSRNKPIIQPAMIQTKPADIAPGADKAILTLSDGTKINLDSLKTGRLILHGNANITKLDNGQLAYQSMHPTVLPQADVFNTLTTPGGGQYKVQLPDGTLVWLNASSSLKYPTAFGGAQRLVELAGEGYFEVAKEPMFPFVIKANGTTVQVLGTHFDINAYTNEPETKVVLVEGSLKFNNTLVLKPGESGSVNKDGNLIKAEADLDVVLAWKNGKFIFKETPMDVVMRQIARWYKAKIVYKDNASLHFNGEIGRNVPVSKLLHLLEATGRVHFTIDQNIITVMK